MARDTPGSQALQWCRGSTWLLLCKAKRRSSARVNSSARVSSILEQWQEAVWLELRQWEREVKERQGQAGDGVG